MNPELTTTTLSSASSRRYFYFTAFVIGAAIMIVEILGAKMLAPYFGTSHFVWTAQIAVTLLALSAGYYAGGRWADRSPNITPLFLALLGAGAYLCLAVLQLERIAYTCMSLNLAAGSLLASVLLFFAPLSLMAMAGPFFIRQLTAEIQTVGSRMGRLTAISTLGSVIGTVLIGYVLIPLLPNSIIMIITAAVLILVSSVWLVIWGRRSHHKKGVAPVIALCIACAWVTGSGGMIEGSKYTELYRCNSNFGQLQVIELRNTPRRALFNDFLEQGAYDTLSKQSLEMFSYMLHDLATAYTANIHDVLCIGMGVGIVPMQFARENALVDVVEINPAMIPAAKRFFDLDPAKLNIITADGRQYLAKNSKKYDAIILDVFLGDSHPSHMMTRESFAAMRKSLNPGGVLVINSFGNFAPGKDFGVSSINKTICDVFPSVKIHADSSSTGSVNVFFVASASDLSMSRASSFDHVSPLCRSNVMAAFRAPILLTQSNAPIPAFSRAPIPAFPRRGKEFLKSPCGGFRGRDCSGIILTDDYNPVDYYDAANREHYRRCQVRYALSWGNRE